MKKWRRSIRIALLLFLVALLLAVPLLAVACGGKEEVEGEYPKMTLSLTYVMGETTTVGKTVQKFADQLKALGKPCELYVVEGEGHGYQKTDNLARQYKGVASFLLKNLA
jgi:acetyl esterase/lipase